MKLSQSWYLLARISQFNYTKDSPMYKHTSSAVHGHWLHALLLAFPKLQAILNNHTDCHTCEDRHSPSPKPPVTGLFHSEAIVEQHGCQHQKAPAAADDGKEGQEAALDTDIDQETLHCNTKRPKQSFDMAFHPYGERRVAEFETRSSILAGVYNVCNDNRKKIRHNYAGCSSHNILVILA